jgi:hypothetical protein
VFRFLLRVSIIVVSVVVGMAMAPPQRVPLLEAAGFDLVDDQGNVIASLRNNRDVPELVFFDKKGQVVTAVTASAHEAVISMGSGDEPSVRIAAKQGTTEMRIKGPRGEMRWSLNNDATQWEMADAKGDVRIRIGTSAQNSADMRFFDSDGRVRLLAGVDEEGRPLLQTRNEQGNLTHDLKSAAAR